MNLAGYRKSIDIIEGKMKESSHDDSFYFFTEAAAIGELELSNKQIKQLFMIMGQAAEFKKTQGTLKGYMPSIDADKVDAPELPDEEIKEEEINELDPMGKLSGMAGGVKSRFGSEKSKRKAKMTRAAVESAKKIWSEWENTSTTSGITPTVTNVAQWLTNKNVGDDILDVSFTNMGITNVMSYIGGSTTPTTTDTGSSLVKWMEDNNIGRGALDGKKSIEFLKSVGISGPKIKKSAEDLGLLKSGSRTISKDQYNKLDNIAKSTLAARSGFEGDDIVSSWLDKEFLSPEEFNGLRAFEMARDYEIETQIINKLFERIGIEQTREYILSKDDRSKLIKMVDIYGTKPEVDAGEDVIDKTEDIVAQAGSSVGQAKTDAQKHINAGDIANMTELQKIGIAVLAARNKVKV